MRNEEPKSRGQEGKQETSLRVNKMSVAISSRKNKWIAASHTLLAMTKKFTCHPELVSGSHDTEIPKQVRNDMNPSPQPSPTRGEGVSSRVDFSLPEKLAFTLAEVLITLGIIGVVAAMTLPTIVNNIRHKELETSFKKAYSSISQALKLYEAQNGTPLLPGDIPTRKLKGMIMPYFKTVKDCGLGKANSSSAEKACVPNPAGWSEQDKTENYKAIYKNYNGTSEINLYAFDDGQFVINDGMLILINNDGGGTNGGRDFQKWISVDVNGYNKRPNRLGQDLFMFRLGESGNLLPGGSAGAYGNGTIDAYCSKTSTDPQNGVGCAIKALSEPDFFKNLP
ncbi:type II secretion system protein [bacterium]|nr:type II secretion system protein [bacterium]